MTVRSYLLTLNLINSSLVFSILIFMVVSYWLVSSGEFVGDRTLLDLLMIVAIGLILMGITAGYFVFRFIIKKIPVTANLKTKLQEYQKAVLVRSACLELPALFAIVSAIVTGSTTFLYVPAALLFIFFLLRPSTQNIVEDLGLTNEKSLFEDINSPIT